MEPLKPTIINKGNEREILGDDVFQSILDCGASYDTVVTMINYLVQLANHNFCRTKALQSINITHQSILRWKKRYPAFAEAESIALDAMVESARDFIKQIINGEIEVDNHLRAQVSLEILKQDERRAAKALLAQTQQVLPEIVVTLIDKPIEDENENN